MQAAPGSSRSGTYGGMGVALVRALAEQGRSAFTLDEARELAHAIGAADSYLAVLLHRLERAGWVRRVKRGTYLLGTGLGFPEAHPFAVGMALIQPCAVSGWSALNHHGLTEQVPRVITLTTPKRVVTPAMRGAVRAAPSSWEVGEQRYEIVSVVPAHFFGDEEVWVGDARVRVFDRERALLDCFALPRRFGGLAEGLGIVEQHVHELQPERLVEHAKRYGKVVVAKRVGWALERLGSVGTPSVKSLQALPMRGYRALDPTRIPKGSRNSRWGLIENLAAPSKRQRS
jgi:predicted transcriptional regulator of viral defense system